MDKIPPDIQINVRPFELKFTIEILESTIALMKNIADPPSTLVQEKFVQKLKKVYQDAQFPHN